MLQSFRGIKPCKIKRNTFCFSIGAFNCQPEGSEGHFEVSEGQLKAKPKGSGSYDVGWPYGSKGRLKGNEGQPKGSVSQAEAWGKTEGIWEPVRRVCGPAKGV